MSVDPSGTVDFDATVPADEPKLVVPEGPDMLPPEPVYTAPIYGGEGHGSGDARQLVVIQPLTDRKLMTSSERILLMESDIREAMALAARRLHAEAMKYSNQGFTWNLDDIAYDHGAARVLTATLRIARNGA